MTDIKKLEGLKIEFAPHFMSGDNISLSPTGFCNFEQDIKLLTSHGFKCISKKEGGRERERERERS